MEKNERRAKECEQEYRNMTKEEQEYWNGLYWDNCIFCKQQCFEMYSVPFTDEERENCDNCKDPNVVHHEHKIYYYYHKRCEEEELRKC